mgnify:CR=1 FL=1
MAKGPSAKTGKLRVGLIGPGRIAVAHLAAVNANRDVAELVAVAGVPSEEERTRELAEKYGALKAVTGADAIFNDPEIDAVILTVPNHLHRSLTIDALEHGKHVLIEKPLSISTADSDDMIAAAKRAGRVLMVGQCRRYFKGAQEAKARIAALGRPLSVIQMLGVYTLEPRTSWWKSAADTGGLALGLNGPHLVDTALWLVGAKPVRVYCQTSRFREGWEGEDEASLMITFDDGSIVSGHLSESLQPPLSETVVIGPNGTLRLVQDRNLWLNGEQIVSEEVRPYIDGDAGFEGQFREFATAIAEGRQPSASGEEIRPVTLVLEGARKSAMEHMPVELTD